MIIFCRLIYILCSVEAQKYLLTSQQLTLQLKHYTLTSYNNLKGSKLELEIPSGFKDIAITRWKKLTDSRGQQVAIVLIIAVNLSVSNNSVQFCWCSVHQSSGLVACC